MLRKTMFAFLCVLGVTFLYLPAYAQEMSAITAESDLISTLLGYFPESWGSWITLVVTICAAVSAIWPRPADNASLVVRLAYLLVNAVGMNAGKAKNADDAAAAKAARL